MKIIQVNMLKKGEHFRISPDDEKMYRRGDFVFKENKYACIRIGKAGATELFAGTELVYRVSVYGEE